MNKKTCYSFMLVMLLLLTTPNNGMAAEWNTSTASVSTTKDWKITLNQPVDRDSITDENIYVEDKSGKRIKAIVERQPGHPKVIWVYAPKDGYKHDQHYTLHVSEQLTSTEGKTLVESLEMKFQIESENIQHIVMGTWKSNYAGFDMVVTFTKDYQSIVEVPSLELVSDGKYSISGKLMKMQLLGNTAKGSVDKTSPNSFTITSASGKEMVFTK